MKAVPGKMRKKKKKKKKKKKRYKTQNIVHPLKHIQTRHVLTSSPGACRFRHIGKKILKKTMTKTRIYEPARLSTPPKPLFSLKPLHANLVEVIVT